MYKNFCFQPNLTICHPSTTMFAMVISLILGCSMVSAQTTLKELASPKKVFIGNIISNAHLDDPDGFRGGLADDHLTEEYNTVVLENYMKMSFVLPSTEPQNIHDLTVEEFRETLNAEKIEKFLSHPSWAGMRKRGHAMIWFNQAPGWLNLVGPTWTGQQVFDFSRKYILALGQICGDRVDEWDVINESISDEAPNGERIWRERTWYRRANDGSMTDWGEATYENYIKMLFVWAREAQPNARLHINDYGIESFSNSPASKNHFMREKVKALKECGAPIDGVGFQSHLTLSNMVDSDGELNTGFIRLVEESIQDLARADLEVAITELDIRICNNDREEAFQEAAFQAYCEMAWSQPNCHEVLIWGLRDEDNWITLRNDSFFAGCEDAVIAEGDNYDPKPAYDGVTKAILSLQDQSQFGFTPIDQGDGGPADCGGEGWITADILQVQGPRVVVPGDQVNVVVSYLATEDQDIVLWFQLDMNPFTVFSQVVRDVSAGSGTMTISLDIPMNVPPGNNQYRYQAFITPDGLGYPERFNETGQNRISVLGDDSELIISLTGPDRVSPGDSVDVTLRYSAGQDQEVVIWFQLDQPPFTTYYEFREEASSGINEIKARIYIPTSVPLGEDAYQYQSLLVPTGGSWPDRVSSLSLSNVDVIMATSVGPAGDQDLNLEVFPNPTDGRFTIKLRQIDTPSDLMVYDANGMVVHREVIPQGRDEVPLELDQIASGLYWVHIKSGQVVGTVKIVKR